MTEAPWTILRVLEATRDWFAKRGIDSARLDAELIIDEFHAACTRLREAVKKSV